MVDLLFGPVPSVGRGVDVVNLLIFHCQSTNLHHLGLKKHIRHHGFIEFIVLLLLLLLLLLVVVVVVLCCCCCSCRRRRRCCCCCCCRQFTTVQLLFGNSHQNSSPRGEWESRVLLVSRSRKTLLSSIAAVGSRSERRVAPTTCEALPRPSMFQCFAGTEKGHCGGRKACAVVKVKVKTTL